MATKLSYSSVSVVIEANQTFPILPTPEPNQAVGRRQNGDQYAERTRPGTRMIHSVRFEMLSKDEYQNIFDFFKGVVDWHRLQFSYTAPDNIARNVWLDSGSFRVDDYTNDFLRLEFRLIEII